MAHTPVRHAWQTIVEQLLAQSFQQIPGPNALGHQALVGSVRRSNGLPVLRDEAVEQIDGLNAVNFPDEPVLPFLNLEQAHCKIEAFSSIFNTTYYKYFQHVHSN